MKLNNELKELLDQKAGKDDLSQLEVLVFVKIDEILGRLKDQFADKGSTNKRVNNLEKKMKQVFLIIVGDTQKGNEEDALVAKKPLNQWSCISCDKNLDRYEGRLGEYRHW